MLELALLFVAGFASGCVNAVAGGGTFITFGALLLMGLPPVTANATSAVAQGPGYVTSTLAYWRNIRQILPEAMNLCLISAGGALMGALLLLRLDNASFRVAVPWLLLAATALFAFGPALKARLVRMGRSRRAIIGGLFSQFVTAVYGGFFGAGMGFVMLAVLGLTQRSGGYHHLNALKNILSTIIASVAITIFILGDAVTWIEAAILMPGVALGGYLGVYIAKLVPEAAVRAFVIVIGLGLTCYYFVKA